MKLHTLYQGVALLSLGMAGLAACTDDVAVGDDSLEKPASAAITKDTVFSNAEYTRQFHNALYSRQYYGLPYGVDHTNYVLPESCSPYIGKFDALTDCYQLDWNSTVVVGSYYSGTLNANGSTLFGFTGEMVWETVRAAYNFIENVGETPDMEDSEKARLIAEAKCIIAARYWDLFQHFGGLPIIDKALEASEASQERPRHTVAETIDFMVGLLDEAIAEPNLPWAVANPDTETGRWTRAAARALKAKILQMGASPIFNPKDGKPYYTGAVSEEQKALIMYTDGDYQGHWDRYFTACEEFFKDLDANGFYELWQATSKNEAGYRWAYRMGYADQSSKETLLTVRHAGMDAFKAGTYCWHQWYTKSVARNTYCPTQEYIEMFGWSNGAPFNWETAYNFTYNTDGTLKTKTGTPINTARSLNGMFVYGTTNSRQQGYNKYTLTRDPRLYEECIVNGQKKYLDWTTGVMSGDPFELWVGGTDALTDIETQSGMFSTGYGFNRYYMGDGTSGSGDYLRKYTQWVYLSLNEMYLMYAEAYLMAKGDVENACAWVDKIRARVGMGTLKTNIFGGKAYTDAAYTASVNAGTAYESNALLEEILRERVCELGLNNIRWFDMIRYKRADWMTKPLHGLKMHRLRQNSEGEWVVNDAAFANGDKLTNKAATQPLYFTYEKVELTNHVRALWNQDPASATVTKWFLMPLPQTEINKNYGLIQNPGW